MMPCRTASLFWISFLQPLSRAIDRPRAATVITGPFTIRLYRLTEPLIGEELLQIRRCLPCNPGVVIAAVADPFLPRADALLERANFIPRERRQGSNALLDGFCLCRAAGLRGRMQTVQIGSSVFEVHVIFDELIGDLSAMHQ